MIRFGPNQAEDSRRIRRIRFTLVWTPNFGYRAWVGVGFRAIVQHSRTSRDARNRSAVTSVPVHFLPGRPHGPLHNLGGSVRLRTALGGGDRPSHHHSTASYSNEQVPFALSRILQRRPRRKSASHHRRKRIEAIIAQICNLYEVSNWF